MEQRVAKQMNKWRHEVKIFDGLPSMFWAGRMAYVATRLTEGSNLLSLMSFNLMLLDKVRREYDAAVTKEPRLVDWLQPTGKLMEKFNQHTNATSFDPDLKPPTAVISKGTKAPE